MFLRKILTYCKKHKSLLATFLVSAALSSSACGMTSEQLARLDTRAGIASDSASHKNALKIRNILKADQSYFYDLSNIDVQNVFDAPDFTRFDAPISVWQYRSDICTVDIYFESFSPDSAETLPVSYFEIRHSEKDILNDADQSAACIKSL